MTQLPKRPLRCLAASLLAALLVAGCAVQPATDGSATASPTDAGLPEAPSDQGYQGADGPHAAPDRAPAPWSVTDSADGRSSVIDVDFGNVTAGSYAAPARGQVITPKEADAATPLVVVSHLRAPNCADGTLAYPCPEGVAENRYDHGMGYLGEALAAAGYTVIVPDLGGLFIGADTAAPYDQKQMWREVVGRFVQELTAPAAAQGLGVELPAGVDTQNVGLVVHSRSGQVVAPAQELFGAAALKAVLAYGPAYDTVELSEISPAPADVPYLAVVGEADADVGASANLWLGHYLNQPRQHPAAVATVPGLGHMYVNRTASSAGTDDRLGCDERDCPDAAAHERLLTAVALDWLAANLQGAQTALPRHSDQPLPTTLADLPVRWLAATPGALAWVDAAQFTASGTDSAFLCTHADPMDPEPPADACPEPDSGVVQVLTTVNRLTDATASVEVSGARGMALHVSPSGTYPGPGSALTVTLGLADGGEYVQVVEATDPALRNRATQADNGVYQLGTVRLELPERVTATTVTSVRVQALDHPVELRGVDFRG